MASFAPQARTTAVRAAPWHTAENSLTEGSHPGNLDYHSKTGSVPNGRSGIAIQGDQIFSRIIRDILQFLELQTKISRSTVRRTQRP